MCSLRASQGGGGATPLVTDNDQFDPDGYRVALQVQPLPPGVEILDFRLFSNQYDITELRAAPAAGAARTGSTEDDARVTEQGKPEKSAS